jgi:hypothetical protein
MRHVFSTTFKGTYSYLLYKFFYITTTWLNIYVQYIQKIDYANLGKSTEDQEVTYASQRMSSDKGYFIQKIEVN